MDFNQICRAARAADPTRGWRFGQGQLEIADARLSRPGGLEHLLGGNVFHELIGPHEVGSEKPCRLL